MIKLTRLNHGLYHPLYTEFAYIFSNDLPKDPADIPPFNLIVDDTKWKVGKRELHHDPNPV